MTRALVSLALASAVLLSACGGTAASDEGGAPEVVAAIYPLAYVAERVGGDAIALSDLTPAGVEPHDVELTPQQVATLAEADLTIFIGGGFQPSVEEALASADGDQLDVLDVVTSDLIAGDPHIWLDPLLLADIGDGVAEALAAADPGEADTFLAGAADLRSDLVELDRLFTETFDDCERSEMVTAHDAFGYLAKRYGLEPIPISGIDPAAEPAARRLAEIAQLAEDRGVTTIFTESLVSPRVAETVAAEAGVATAVLDPIESEPDGSDYLAAMAANLQALSEALGCSS